MEPIIASNNLETAVVPHTDDLPREEEEAESAESSSESENEDDLPPGPVNPEKCTVGGPGTSGGSAQVQAYAEQALKSTHLPKCNYYHASLFETCIKKLF